MLLLFGVLNMSTTDTVILGVCLLASAFIVALPGLDSMRHEYRIREICESSFIATHTLAKGDLLARQVVMAIEHCVKDRKLP